MTEITANRSELHRISGTDNDAFLQLTASNNTLADLKRKDSPICAALGEYGFSGGLETLYVSSEQTLHSEALDYLAKHAGSVAVNVGGGELFSVKRAMNPANINQTLRMPNR